MNYSLSRSQLRNQFVVSRELGPAWPHRIEFEEWKLGYGEGIALTKILDRNDDLVGVFLGTLIDLETESYEPESIAIPWAANECQNRELEDFLYAKAGSWIAIIITAKKSAVYLDPCGSMPVVYSLNQPVAGSSSGVLIKQSEYFDDLCEEVQSESWFKQDFFFPAGLTSHHSIRRLLPNHKLDLCNWATKRIWPRATLRAMRMDDATDEIVSAARAVIDVTLNNNQTLFPLTAGNETRTLLSLIRDRRHEPLFFTAKFPGSSVDLGTACRLAERFGLRHVVVPCANRTQEERLERYRRTGHDVGGPLAYFKLRREAIENVDAELSGAAGEVGRGFFWTKFDARPQDMKSAILLARLKLPNIPRFEVAIAKWLETVAQFDILTVLDLAYIELRMASWAAPHYCGSDANIPQIWPLVTRKGFTAMMSLPSEIRRDQSVFASIIKREWPELLQIPINRGTAVENMQSLFYRASSPKRVWNFVKKKFPRQPLGT